ncbi:MAG: pyrimidine utilization protein D [Pseudomonadota bacterium]
MKYTHLRSGRTSARTLVLSAGLGGAAGFWKPHIDAFSAEFDLLLYDQRGTGENAETLGPTSITDMADDVLAICDAAGVERFDLVGHALGGLIGLDLAARRPERLDRLIGINAWPEIDHHTARCFDIRLGVLAGQGLAPFVALQQNFLYPPSFISAHPDRIAAEVAHAIAHFQGAENLTHRINALRAFRLPDLTETATKVLLIASKDDALVDVAQSERLAARVPNARLTIYDQGGHALNITQQARFEADALEFLNDR